MRYSSIILLSLSLLIQYTLTKNIKHPSLDKLADQFNTDKGPSWHNYTKIYTHYFKPLQNKQLKFLEIGFYKGASAHMWDNYFPHATLHFIDIDAPKLRPYTQGLSKRCHLHKVDQSNSRELQDFIKLTGSNFDIIIDDGSHFVDHQITSFITLFPHVTPGGLYIIEDMHTSYWQIYGGSGTREHPQASPKSAIRFFQALVDHVNYVGARTQCADISKYPSVLFNNLNYYQKHIASIHFYDSLCIILKR